MPPTIIGKKNPLIRAGFGLLSSGIQATLVRTKGALGQIRQAIND